MLISSLIWDFSRLGEGIETLCKDAKLKTLSAQPLVLSSAIEGENEINRWVDWAINSLGLDAEKIDTALFGLEKTLKKVNPAVLFLKQESASGFFLLLKSSKNRLTLIGPDLEHHVCYIDELYEFMTFPYIAPYFSDIEHLFKNIEVSEKKRQSVTEILLQDRLGLMQIGSCWMLRAPISAPIKSQLLQLKLPQKFAFMIGLLFVVYMIEISSWGLIGKITLNDHFDMGWFFAWGILTFTLIFAHLFFTWIESNLTLEISRIFKQRLLFGALNIKIDVFKFLGIGRLLSSVMESQAIESLVFNGGIGILIGFVELIFSAIVLSVGVSSSLHLYFLFLYSVLIIFNSNKYFKFLDSWTNTRFEMTNNLVESMVGQRTRLAQEPILNRHHHEDLTLQTYLKVSKKMDNAYVPIISFLPTFWLILGFIGLAPDFISGSSNSTELAITLGGILLANRAMTSISNGITSLARAGIAWKHIADFFKSVGTNVNKSPFIIRSDVNDNKHGRNSLKILEMSNISYGYPNSNHKIFDSLNFSLYQGERVLLEGGSGSGKSTFASLIVGVRKPEGGLLLLNGLDRHTLGNAWHELITESPQFHENHIFSGSLAFNLLMGRNWPASQEEIEEAKMICSELLLDDLINRMPSGLLQTVGETGWQLSHGEKSRIFLARALLQKAQITILDESFASLDPETLKVCLNCAFKYARTLIVIAHP